MTTATTPKWTTGDRLRKAREHAGITVADMAATLGVTRNTITNYEHDRTSVTVDALRRYAAATGVDAAWLLAPEDDEIKNRCFSQDQLSLPFALLADELLAAA